MNHIHQNHSRRIRTSLLACAALLTATIVAPTPAKAEPSLTAIALIGGAAVIGTMLWTHHDTMQVQASSTNPGSAPAYVTQPYPAISPPYTNGAVIYASVTPVATMPPAPQTVYHVASPIAYYNQPTPSVQMPVPQYAQQQVAPQPMAPQPVAAQPAAVQSAAKPVETQRF